LLRIRSINDALFYARKSLSLCKEPIISSKNLRIIVYAYLLQSNFEKALESFNQALSVISTLSAHGRKEAESDLYALIGWGYSVTFFSKEKAVLAKKYLHKSLSLLKADYSLYEKYNNKDKNPEKISCEVLKSKINLGEAHCHLGEYKNAYELGFRESKFITLYKLDSCHQHICQVHEQHGMGEILLRENKLIEAKHVLAEAVKRASNIAGSSNLLSLSPRIFSIEACIRLGELDLAYKYCSTLFDFDTNKVQTNYYKLIYSMVYYHAAIIKYKQGDIKESLAHFKTFFLHIDNVCKLALTEQQYCMLKEKDLFKIPSDTQSDEFSLIKQCFKNATRIFYEIYGKDHPFVKDYVVLQ
jgi:tetratricopeptide (TPR) repeat protein